MKSNKLIIFWGATDLICFSAIILSSVLNGDIPVFHELQKQLKVGRIFEHPIAIWGPVIGAIVLLTVPVSGWFLMRGKTLGGYLSLVHLPFRLLLIMPPTFFYLSKFSLVMPNGQLLFLTLIYIIEFLKGLTVGWWLYKSQRTYRNEST